MGKYDSGYEKIPRDFYATPHAVTQALLVAEMFDSKDQIYDPACGEGHILDAALSLGIQSVGTDLRETGRGMVLDFLTARWLQFSSAIVTNPPYGVQGRLAVKFIEHSLKITKQHKKRVCMLLPENFDCGKTRRHLFGDCPQFARKYTLTDRIRWANLPQKENGPKENHAWYVWSWQRLPGGPNQKYLHGTGS